MNRYWHSSTTSSSVDYVEYKRSRGYYYGPSPSLRMKYTIDKIAGVKLGDKIEEPVEEPEPQQMPKEPVLFDPKELVT